MAEFICIFGKDSAEIVINQPKKSPLFLRMVVLVFAMVCGLYISSVCVKQFGNINLEGTQLVQTPSFPHSLHVVTHTFNLAECGNNPVRFFAILSTQRSGSGWFETLLNSHNNVTSNGEIFSVLDRRRNISSIIQTLDRVYNLDWFTSASKNQCSAAIGFKWMLNQGLLHNHREIVDYFNRRTTRLYFYLEGIHLVCIGKFL